MFLQSGYIRTYVYTYLTRRSDNRCLKNDLNIVSGPLDSCVGLKMVGTSILYRSIFLIFYDHQKGSQTCQK